MQKDLYRPLVSNIFCTRLLTLEPGRLWDPLVASLAEANFHDGTKYEALSYTWGTAGNEKLIILNNIELEIRENLWRALQRIRNERKPRTIWMDALSISQRDLREKAEQVSVIGDIFGNAQRVLMWVGEHADDSEKLFRGRSVAQNAEWMLQKLSTRLASKISLRRDVPMWWIFRSFLDRPYFWRTWIVQEIIQAKTLMVHCGEDSCTWDSLIGSRISSKDSIVDPQRYDVGSTRQMQNHVKQIWHVANIQHVRIQYQRSRAASSDYSDVVDFFGKFQYTCCADRRDKVFALLSFMPDSFQLQPDYTLSVEELFLEVCDVFSEDDSQFVGVIRLRVILTIKNLNLENEELIGLLRKLLKNENGRWTKPQRAMLFDTLINEAEERSTGESIGNMEDWPFDELEAKAEAIVRDGIIESKMHGKLPVQPKDGPRRFYTELDELEARYGPGRSDSANSLKDEL